MHLGYQFSSVMFLHATTLAHKGPPGAHRPPPLPPVCKQEFLQIALNHTHIHCDHTLPDNPLPPRREWTSCTDVACSLMYTSVFSIQTLCTYISLASYIYNIHMLHIIYTGSIYHATLHIKSYKIVSTIT